MQKRHQNPKLCYELANGWLNINEGNAETLKVNFDIFFNAIQLFITQVNERKALRVTDCTIVKICEINSIQNLVTFDEGFDGYLDVISV